MSDRSDSRSSAPGEPLEPGQPIWVITSRCLPISAKCIRTEGMRVWVEYPNGRTTTVNIHETAPRGPEETYWLPPKVKRSL